MLAGTVIIAHNDPMLTAGVERILNGNCPGVKVERTERGRDALMMQSLMRADAVLTGLSFADMPGEHLVRELRRDIANPYIMVCARERSGAEKRALAMGAHRFVPIPADVMQVSDIIEEQLRLRAGKADSYGSMAETMLQRIFADYGIPCGLKGYAFMKHALMLLNEGEARLDSMKDLYEKVGMRFGCGAGAVEHGIRYAIMQCSRRMDFRQEMKLSNKAFIAQLLEDAEAGRQTMIKPRVSVFCSGRRVFR